MRANTRKKAKQQKPVEVMSVSYSAEKEEDTDRAVAVSIHTDYEDFNLLTGDLLLIDKAVEPTPGEPAGYKVISDDGKQQFTVRKFRESDETDAEYLGMVTHVLRQIYKTPDEILSSEFLTEE
jgi:hypothetical protein